MLHSVTTVTEQHDTIAILVTLLPPTMLLVNQVACAPGLAVSGEKAAEGLEYVVESTGARCPSVCAPNVLEQYCAQLPGNTGWVGTVFTL